MKEIIRKIFLESLYEVNDDSMLAEMANLSKTVTKLPLVIYISTKDGVKHGPRIKVNSEYSNNKVDSSFTITVSRRPTVIGKTFKIKASDIETISDWILLNYDILMKYWNKSIDLLTFEKEMKHL